jgi:hypothetical protein
VAWLSSTTTLECQPQLSGLLIVDPHDTVGSASRELGTIRLVVYSEELVELVVDGVEQFATCGVPVLQAAICVNGDEHVLGNAWGL